MDAGNEVIELDEYTFHNADDFKKFVNGIQGDNNEGTLQMANFAKEHHDTLTQLEGCSTVATQVETILKAENATVKEKAISVNGVKYTPITINKKGDIIKFGDYPQDSNGSKSPIEWLVLDVKGNEALLISRYGLDCKQYHHNYTDITWEDCDLRKWLNNDFLKSAFSNEESERILVSELRNDDNPEYGKRGGNDTKDRIFCLSIAEALQYFSSDEDRQCRPTAYARDEGAGIYNDCCSWWLRSPGYIQRDATSVDAGGALDLRGDPVCKRNGAVRPALRIICNL